MDYTAYFGIFFLLLLGLAAIIVGAYFFTTNKQEGNTIPAWDIALIIFGIILTAILIIVGFRLYSNKI